MKEAAFVISFLLALGGCLPLSAAEQQQKKPALTAAEAQDLVKRYGNEAAPAADPQQKQKKKKPGLTPEEVQEVLVLYSSVPAKPAEKANAQPEVVLPPDELVEPPKTQAPPPAETKKAQAIVGRTMRQTAALKPKGSKAVLTPEEVQEMVFRYSSVPVNQPEKGAMPPETALPPDELVGQKKPPANPPAKKTAASTSAAAAGKRPVLTPEEVQEMLVRYSSVPVNQSEEGVPPDEPIGPQSLESKPAIEQKTVVPVPSAGAGGTNQKKPLTAAEAHELVKRYGGTQPAKQQQASSSAQPEVLLPPDELVEPQKTQQQPQPAASQEKTPGSNANPAAQQKAEPAKAEGTEVILPPDELIEPQKPPAQQPKDDVAKTIDEAFQQYKSEDFAGAVSNLDYAVQLIRQKKSERIKSLLPGPRAGWQAKPATAQFLGTSVFGGGVTVSRDYIAGSGSAVSIEIVSDSPVLQSIIMMLNNPLFAGAAGGNLKTIKGQRAIIRYDEKKRGGEINIVVAGRFIVTVKGQRTELDDLNAYAEAMDFDELAKN